MYLLVVKDSEAAKPRFRAFRVEQKAQWEAVSYMQNHPRSSAWVLNLALE
jgi:hypothetical protein